MVERWRKFGEAFHDAAIEKACGRRVQLHACAFGPSLENFLKSMPKPAAPDSSLGLDKELKFWRASASELGQSLKSRGNPVIHHCYLTAHLLPDDVPEDDLTPKFAAAVGDRVRRNNESRKIGTITDVEGDGGTEVAVQWDDGAVSNQLWCGKKNGFHLLYL